jgi:hypothetical protein
VVAVVGGEEEVPPALVSSATVVVSMAGRQRNSGPKIVPIAAGSGSLLLGLIVVAFGRRRKGAQ